MAKQDAFETRCMVFVVSDATGATAETVVRAALTQFETVGTEIRRIPNVRRKEQVRSIIREASSQGVGVIVHTLVSPELREAMLHASRRANVPAIDLMGPLLRRLENILKISPLAQPGLFRHLNEDYFRRMEAIDFSVSHDDGRQPQDLPLADIVLVGVSRTSKTPLSTFLSYRGWRVANVPLLPEVEPPAELEQLEVGKVIGLTISPERLRQIRVARVQRMGYGLQQHYVDRRRIEHELRYSLELFQKCRWPIVDVTGKSIEEAAGEIAALVQRTPGEPESW